MASRERSHPRRTEPEPVPDLFVTAVALDGTGEYLRFTGWVAHASQQSTLAVEPVPEHRVVVRLVMPPSTARDLAQRLRRFLPRGDGG